MESYFVGNIIYYVVDTDRYINYIVFYTNVIVNEKLVFIQVNFVSEDIIYKKYKKY